MQPSRLASLVSSHLCHDLVSPVSALTTALELMEDASSDQELMDQAMELLANSTKQATAKLELFRVAYGAGGSIGGTKVEMTKVRGILEGFFDVSKPDFEWNGSAILASKNAIKLLLNMCLIAFDSLPRGGHIRATSNDSDGYLHIIVEANGPRATLKPQTASILSGSTEEIAGLEPHNIQPYYAHCIAEEEGTKIQAEQTGDDVTLEVTVRT